MASLNIFKVIQVTLKNVFCLKQNIFLLKLFTNTIFVKKKILCSTVIAKEKHLH